MAIIIKQMHSQEGVTNTQQNCRYFRIKCVVDLLCDQPYSLVHKLPALAIHHWMLVDPEMNSYSND